MSKRESRLKLTVESGILQLSDKLRYIIEQVKMADVTIECATNYQA